MPRSKYTRTPDWRTDFFYGIDNNYTEDLIKAKQYKSTKLRVPVIVSTRGVGFSSAEIFERVRLVPDNIRKLPEVTVHQIYRVQLAAVEYVIAKNCEQSYTEWYSPSAFSPYIEAITSINLFTKRVGLLIKSISYFKFNETTFVPTFPPEQIDPRLGLIPTPEYVYISNLRRVVEYLSNPNTTRDIRVNFREKNPIPGATWDDVNQVLINANEIMPENYSRDDYHTDLYGVKMWMKAALNLTNSNVKLFSIVDLHKLESGNESIFVSNESQNLHLENNTVYGDVNHYWIPQSISKAMTFYGAYHLGGEIGSINRYMWPYSALRQRICAGFETRRSYRGEVLTVEA